MSKIDVIRKDFGVFKWTISLIWKIDKKTFTLWSVISILGALTPVVFLNINKLIIDKISQTTASGDSYSNIVMWIAIFISFLFIKSVYDMVPGLLYPLMHNKYGMEMQRKISETLQKVPLRLFDDSTTTTQIEMIETKSKEIAFFISPALSFFTSIISIISLLIMTLNNSWILFIAGILLLVVSIPFGFNNAMKQFGFWKAEGKADKIVNYYSGLVFNRSLAKEYRIFNMDYFMRKKWYDTAEPLRKRRRKHDESQQFMWNVLNFATSIINFGTILLGFTLIKNSRLTIGELVMFVSLFGQLSGNCSSLGQKFMHMYSSIKLLGYQKEFFETDFSEKYSDVADEQMEMPTPDKPEEAPTVFELKNVSYCYRPNVYALKDVSFKIRKGEIVALVGSNGAGKSTLVKILLGFYTPTEGRVFFEGKNYREVDFSKFVNRMGVSFQDYAKFELTIRENIAFGDISKVNDDNAIHDAINKSGATKIVGRMKNGIDTYIGRWYTDKGTEMSGGEWQKVVMSRAHLSNRAIMILDEPAAKLDPIAELEQFNSIKNSIEGRTAILISHRIGFAKLADKVAVLDEGRLVEFGTHNELMKLKGKYYDMFTTQASWYQKEGAVNE